MELTKTSYVFNLKQTDATTALFPIHQLAREVAEFERDAMRGFLLFAAAEWPPSMFS